MATESRIYVSAFVSEGEQAAVRLAAGHIARALGQAADVPWTCDWVFSPDMETLRRNRDGSIILTSLVPALGDMEESWSRVEERLRTAYVALSERGVPVFISTILRHVGHEEKVELAAAIRIRIRRLNLLASEISRETGAYVIDLDRILADIGARRLRTDYRLVGDAAAEMAGYFISLAVISNALDAFVSAEIQDAARVILTSSRPVVAAPEGAKSDIARRMNLQSMGHGRQKQIVSTVTYTIQESYSEWLLRQVLKGGIEPTQVLRRLVQAVRRRGVRETAARLGSGLSRLMTRKNSNRLERHGG